MINEDFMDWTLDTYGSFEGLAQEIDKGLEMLFYLEDSTFTKEEVQTVSFALRGIVVALRRTD